MAARIISTLSDRVFLDGQPVQLASELLPHNKALTITVRSSSLEGEALLVQAVFYLPLLSQI